ncbi:hypothetical protein APED_03070 [Acanthopleuribacter pedis]
MGFAGEAGPSFVLWETDWQGWFEDGAWVWFFWWRFFAALVRLRAWGWMRIGRASLFALVPDLDGAVASEAGWVLVIRRKLLRDAMTDSSTCLAGDFSCTHL